MQVLVPRSPPALFGNLCAKRPPIERTWCSHCLGQCLGKGPGALGERLHKGLDRVLVVPVPANDPLGEVGLAGIAALVREQVPVEVDRDE